MDALAISRTGLDVEWRRMEIIAQNIANLNTSRTADGGSYFPLRLVSGPAGSFGATLARQQHKTGGNSTAQGVAVYGVEHMNGGQKRSYDPQHPHADSDGFVTLPAFSQAEEMTLMIKTSRAYEANLVAMAAAQQMYSSALQLGRPS